MAKGNSTKIMSLILLIGLPILAYKNINNTIEEKKLYSHVDSSAVEIQYELAGGRELLDEAKYELNRTKKLLSERKELWNKADSLLSIVDSFYDGQ